MNRLLEKLFRLESDERDRVFAFMFLGGLLQAGLAIGLSAADSLFLVHVGPDRLPLIYVATPMMMIGYIPTYSFLLGRYGVDKVFGFTLALLVFGGVAFYFLLRFEASTPVYYAIKLWGALWYIGLYSLFWSFVDGYFDLAKAKRLFGLLAAGPAAGAIVGGSIVNQFAHRLGVQTLFLIWAALALATWPLLRTIRRRYKPLPASHDAEGETRPALRDTLRRMIGSRYITVLVIVLFLTLVTATICEYQYLHIFSESADENTLAALFGELFAAVNVFNLCIALFVFHKLVLRIGVRNTALIQPIAYLVVFALLLIHSGFGSALLGFLAYQGIMTSIDFNNVNLLFNGMPEEGKSQVRTFVEGICEPLATATAGVFLFFIAPRLSPENLSVIGFACAIVLLLFIFVLRVDYAESMVANVRKSWLDFSGSLTASLKGLRESDLAFLETRAEKPVAGERLTALRLLWLNAPPRALGRMFAFLPSASRAERRAAQPLVSAMLASNDPRLLLQSMQWSERHVDTADSFLLEELGRHRLVPAEAGTARLQSADPAERAAGAALLWRSARLPDGRVALEAVDELLHAGAEETLAGIHGLGRIGEPRFVPHLLPHLHSKDPAVRIEALRALQHLANRESTRLVKPLLDLLAAGGTVEERQLVLDLLGRIADSSSLAPLLALAGRFSPHERRLTERLVVEFGPRAVPTLVNVVQNLDFPLFARSIALRTLGRLAFPQLEALAPALIDALVQRSYMLVGCSAALSAVPNPGAGVAMLAFVYRGLPRLTLEMSLEVLSVTGRLPGYDSIVGALRSGHPRDRAYAIENIEQGCGRRLFAQLEPFLDGRETAAIAAAGRKLGLANATSADDAINRSLKVRFPLEAAAALQALAETRPDEAPAAALEKLRLDPAPLLRDTALTLLARNQSGTTSRLTPIERLHRISRTEFFSEWGVRQLEFISRDMREISLAPGEILFRTGDVADSAYVVLEGRVSAEEATGPRAVPAGEIVGEESLLGSALRPATARAETAARVVFIPAADVIACAGIHAQVAMELFRRKLARA